MALLNQVTLHYEGDPIICVADKDSGRVELTFYDAGYAIEYQVDAQEVRALRDWLTDWLSRNTNADWPIRRNDGTN